MKSTGSTGVEGFSFGPEADCQHLQDLLDLIWILTSRTIRRVQVAHCACQGGTTSALGRKGLVRERVKQTIGVDNDMMTNWCEDPGTL